MAACKTCGDPLPARHYELRATVTLWGPVPSEKSTGAYGEGETYCSARCILLRAARLIDDANGTTVHTALRLTEAARDRVRRATVTRPGWRVVA